MAQVEIGKLYRDPISGEAFRAETLTPTGQIGVQILSGRYRGEERVFSRKYVEEECTEMGDQRVLAKREVPEGMYYSPPFDPDLASVTAADLATALQYLDETDKIVRFESSPVGVYFGIGKPGEMKLAKNFEAAVIIAAMEAGWERR